MLKVQMSLNDYFHLSKRRNDKGVTHQAQQRDLSVTKPLK
jgi:hypothetical protein